MIISCNNLGRFEPSNFDMTAFIANEFIPLVSVQNSFSIEDIQMYSKPSFEIVIRKPNTLKNIKDGFQYGHTAREIAINNRKFFIAKGVFFSEQRVPLMVCAMKKEAYFSPEVAKFSDLYNEGTFSYNNYVLFYSTSFFTDPGLTPLNRRLQKEILQSCYEKGIEVRVIPSSEIEKNTFARLFEVKKTKSLTQLEAYMNQVLPDFLHNGGEDIFVEQEFEPVVIHREELSVEEEAMLFDNEATPVVENLYVTHNVTGSIAQLSAEARELAEIQAEAALFDHQPELSNEDDQDDEDWLDEDFEDSNEEETAHTVYPYTALNSFIDANGNIVDSVSPQTAQSLVERIRPLQETYDLQMLRAQQATQLNAEMVHVRAWQSIIEVVDDTE